MGLTRGYLGENGGMKCPNDSTTLVMSDRSGVEIDYCPECRGVWLDRGELDKIIDRAGSQPGPAAAPTAPAAPAAPAYQAPPVQQPYQQPPVQQPYQQPQYQQPQYRNNNNNGYGQQPYRKKKDNWLSDLFD